MGTSMSHRKSTVGRGVGSYKAISDTSKVNESFVQEHFECGL